MDIEERMSVFFTGNAYMTITCLDMLIAVAGLFANVIVVINFIKIYGVKKFQVRTCRDSFWFLFLYYTSGA